MSTFSVIMLAIVAYFIVGGFIMGLIDNSQQIMEYVYFWPVHVMVWLIEVGEDLAEGVKEIVRKWRRK